MKDEIWRFEVEDGCLTIRKELLPHSGYREEREYVLYHETAVGSRAVCKVGEDGRVKKWYEPSSEGCKAFQDALKELPGILAMIQVMNA